MTFFRATTLLCIPFITKSAFSSFVPAALLEFQSWRTPDTFEYIPLSTIPPIISHVTVKAPTEFRVFRDFLLSNNAYDDFFELPVDHESVINELEIMHKQIWTLLRSGTELTIDAALTVDSHLKSLFDHLFLHSENEQTRE